MGGGTVLMAAMGQVLPPTLLIPIHGIVQLGSNLSRVLLGLKEVRREIFLHYLYGALVGALVGLFVPVTFSPKLIAISVAVFILISTWIPLYKLVRTGGAFNYGVLGSLSTFLSLFIGISGPLIHPFLVKDPRIDRHSFIATEASCAGLTHFLKIIIFVRWGFRVDGYWLALLAMVVMTFVGAYLGKLALHKISERHFKIVVKILVSVLAIRMLFSVVT